MLSERSWVESPTRDQLYRGQRNACWDTIPTLFRKPNLDVELAKLETAAGRVRACLPGVDDYQTVAVAQHYSTELDVATWLLDVTWDPRVALFFASDGGLAKQIGVVTCIVRAEWQRLSAGGSNRLGPLRVIDVAGVSRIENQRASFLDTSHPALLAQYVGHSVWFRQIEGLRFEDDELAHPVTVERIYPAEDPVLKALRATSSAPAAPLRCRPAGDAREVLGCDAYDEIARSWARQKGVEIDVYREDTLRVVCDVHTRLQARSAGFALPERSLHRLEDAVELIVNAQRSGTFISPRGALRRSLERLNPDRRTILDALITECARKRDLC